MQSVFLPSASAAFFCIDRLVLDAPSTCGLVVAFGLGSAAVPALPPRWLCRRAGSAAALALRPCWLCRRAGSAAVPALPPGACLCAFVATSRAPRAASRATPRPPRAPSRLPFPIVSRTSRSISSFEPRPLSARRLYSEYSLAVSQNTLSAIVVCPKKAPLLWEPAPSAD